MFEKVCNYLRQRKLYVTPAEQQAVREHTRHRMIPAHTVIMHQGKPVRRMYFVNEGIVRLFRIHNGVDVTLGIVSVNDFLSAPHFLFSGSHSTCGLETLTEADVLEWDKNDLIAIRKEVAHFDRIEMAVMDRLLNWVQEGQINAMCLTAEERYQKLIREQPELFQRIPLKYIASLLNIHQDSLSRIRKTVVSKS